MVISDPTIDPITGLPVLDTSGIVQQIPLGRQTVDYAGWNATAQPTRSPIYPDDVIPVFANVQGQHPTTGNAQNVGTDGKNALLVSDVNAGSGGGFAPLKFKQYFSYELDQATNTQRNDNNIDTMSLLVGAELDCVVRASEFTGNVGGYFAVSLNNMGQSPFMIYLGVCLIVGEAGQVVQPYRWHAHAPLVQPLDLTQYSYTPTDNWYLYYQNNSGVTASMMVTLYYI